jgi:hypothetical protein
MENVILIGEDNHGYIGVARNYKRAVEFIIDSEWIDRDFEVLWKGEYIPISVALGEDWKEKLLNNYNVDSFNELTNYYIQFEVQDLY